jgi:hypothetical protein
VEKERLRRAFAPRPLALPLHPSENRDVLSTKNKQNHFDAFIRISKNSDHFEMWCMHQNLERVVYDDIPGGFKKEVEKVFDVNERLPLAWVDKVCECLFRMLSGDFNRLYQDSKEYKSLLTFAPPSFISFIAQAYEEEPSLFGKEVQGLADLYLALSKVFSAWNHLKSMLSSVDKWSEADFTNVCVAYLDECSTCLQV